MIQNEKLELEIEPAKIESDNNKLFDLETLITEGKNSKVPIEIEFPDGRKAGAYIRPITTAEFQTIYDGNASEILINVLEKALIKKDGNNLSRELIGAMPVGLPAKIVQEIFEISGIETDEETARQLSNQLELFP